MPENDFSDPFDFGSLQGNTNYDELAPTSEVVKANTRFASPAWRKYINATLSVEDKYNIIKEHGLQKDLDLSGYKKGYLIKSPDADSGVLLDEETGVPFEYRAKDYANYDATDSWDSVYKSKNKQRSQPEMVAELVGKKVEELTPEDYLNVKNYQHQQFIESLTNPNHQFTPYDKNRQYASLNLGEDLKIPVYYKSTDVGYYGRALTEIVSSDGRPVTFQATQNPYLNVTNADYQNPNQKFDLYKALDTPENREVLAQFQSQKGIDFAKKMVEANERLRSEGILSEKDIENYRNNTGLFSQFVDQLGYLKDRSKSGVLQILARTVRTILPDAIIDRGYWDDLTKKLDNGMTVADIVAGISPERFAIHQGLLRENDALYDKISEEWKNGNESTAAKAVVSYIGNSFLMLPELIADSLPQMGTSIATGLAAGKAGAAIGTAVAPGIGTAVGAMVGIIGNFVGQAGLVALDETVQARDEFKENNNGKEMSPEETLALFSEHLLAAAPEALLNMLAIGKLLPKKLAGAILGKNKLVENVVHKNTIIKSMAEGALGETIQEPIQNAISAYHSQAEGDNRKSFMEVLTDKEQIQSAIYAALMGGTLPGISGSLGSIKAHKAVKTLGEIQKVWKENTPTGESASTEVSRKSVTDLQTLTTTYTNSKKTTDDLKSYIKSLDEISSRKGLNAVTVDNVKRVRSAAILEHYKQLVDNKADTATKEAFFNAVGRTAEEIIAETIHFSGPSVATNKQLTEAGKEQLQKELIELGKKSGDFTEEFVKATFENVAQQIRYGVGGFETYLDNIKHLGEALQDTNITAEESQALEKNLLSNKAKLNHLFKNQLDKTREFATALETLLNDPVANSARADWGTGSFLFHRSNLITTNKDGSPNKVQRLLNFVQQETTDLLTALKSLPQAYTKGLVFDSNQLTQLKKKIESSLAELRKGATERAKKDYKYAPTDALAKLEYIIKYGESGDKNNLFSSIIRSLSDKEVEDLHKFIDSRRTGETVKQLHDTLSSITGKVHEDTSTLDKVAKDRKHNDAILEDLKIKTARLKKLLGKVNEDNVEKIGNAVLKVRKEAANLFKKTRNFLATATKDQLAVGQEYNSVEEQLRNEVIAVHKKIAESQQNNKPKPTNDTVTVNKIRGILNTLRSLEHKSINIKTYQDFAKRLKDNVEQAKKLLATLSNDNAKKSLTRVLNALSKKYTAKYNQGINNPRFKEALARQQQNKAERDKIVNKNRLQAARNDLLKLNNLVLSLENGKLSSKRREDVIQAISMQETKLRNILANISNDTEGREDFETAISKLITRSKEAIASKPASNKPIENKPVKPLTKVQEKAAASIRKAIDKIKDKTNKLLDKPTPSKFNSYVYYINNNSSNIKNSITNKLPVDHPIVKELTDLLQSAINDARAKYIEVRNALKNKKKNTSKSSKNDSQEVNSSQPSTSTQTEVPNDSEGNSEPNSGTSSEVITEEKPSEEQQANDAGLIEELSDSSKQFAKAEVLMKEAEAKNDKNIALDVLNLFVTDVDIDFNNEEQIDKTLSYLARISRITQRSITSYIDDFKQYIGTSALFDKKANELLHGKPLEDKPQKPTETPPTSSKPSSKPTSTNDDGITEEDLEALRALRSGKGLSEAEQQAIAAYAAGEGAEASGDFGEDIGGFDEYSEIPPESFESDETGKPDTSIESEEKSSQNRNMSDSAVPRVKILNRTEKANLRANRLKEVRSKFDVTEDESNLNDADWFNSIKSKKEQWVTRSNTKPNENQHAESGIDYDNYNENIFGYTTKNQEGKTTIVSATNQVIQQVNAFSDQDKRNLIRKGLRPQAEPTTDIGILGLDEYARGVVKGLKKYFPIIEHTYDRVTPKVSGKNFVTDENGNMVKERTHIEKAEQALAATLDGSPHFQILYNQIIKEDGRFAFVPNEATIFAIHYAVTAYLASGQYANALNPVGDQISDIFGIDSDSVDLADAQQLKTVINNYGVPLNSMANTLGKMVADALGIGSNMGSNGLIGYYEHVIAGLGGEAINYMIKSGVLTEKFYNPQTFVEEGKLSLNEVVVRQPQWMVKLNKQYFNIAKHRAIKRYFTNNLQPRYELNPAVKEPSLNTIKTDLPNKIKRTNGFSNVPELVQGVMQKLASTPHEIDMDLVDVIRKNRNGVLKALGYIEEKSPEWNALSYDQQQSVEGSNRAILNQVDSLLEWADKQKESMNRGDFKGIFFDYFEGKNGRLYLDSSTLNPQSGKQLQRFLTLPRDSWMEVRINSKTMLHDERYAIAQAFDSLGNEKDMQQLADAMNKLDIKQLDMLMDILCNDSENLAERAKNELGVDGIGGIENFGQCLNVVQHLKRKREAINAGKKKFVSNLTVENDSTTSGYFLKILEFPHPSVLKEFAIKVGIVLDPKDKNYSKKVMHEIKKLADFQDVYRTFGKQVGDSLFRNMDDKNKYKSHIQSLYDKELANKLKGKDDDKRIEIRNKSVDPDFKRGLFVSLTPSLPKPDKNGKVSSALRALMKPPVMVFGYTAGAKSIQRKIANTLMDEYIAKYMKLMFKLDNMKVNKFKPEEALKHLNEEERAIYNFFDKLSKHSKSHIYGQLKSKSVSKIWIKVPNANKNGKGTCNRSLSMIFSELMLCTYGETTVKMMDKAFRYFEQVNDTMNNACAMQFNMFNKVWQKELGKLKEKYKVSTKSKSGTAYIPVSEYNATIKRVLDILPAIPTIYNRFDTNNDGKRSELEKSMILFMSTQKRINDDTQVTTFLQDSKEGTREARIYRPNTYDFTNAGKAGAVFPIHFLDGMSMAVTIALVKAGILPIHDAIGMSAFLNRMITSTFNMDMTLLSKDYNIFEEMFKRTVEVAYRASRYLAEDNLKENDLFTNTRNDYKASEQIKNDRAANLVKDLINIYKRPKDESGVNGRELFTRIVEGDMPDAVLDGLLTYAGRKAKKEIGEAGYKHVVEAVQDAINNTFDSEMLDPFDNPVTSVMDTTAESLTLREFLYGMYKGVLENNQNREKLYSQKFTITNVDGGGSITTTENGKKVTSSSLYGYDPSDTANEKIFANITESVAEDVSNLLRAVYPDSEVKGSGPERFMTVSGISDLINQTKLLQDRDASLEARKALLDQLQGTARARGNRVASDAHIAHLKAMLDYVNPATLAETVVRYADDAYYNIAQVQDKNIILGLEDTTNAANVDPITHLSVNSDKSAAEMYVHECMHIGLDFAFRNREMLNINRSIKQLENLQEQAAKVISWQDFMPDTYDSSLKDLYETHAKNLWNYLFNNPNPNLEGLNEFCVYAVTNEKVMEKLSKATTRNAPVSGRLLDKIIALVQSILDVALGRKKFSEAFSLAHEMLKGNVSPRQRDTLLAETDRLVKKLMAADRKAARKIYTHPLRAVEGVFNILHDAKMWANPRLAKFLNSAVTILDRNARVVNWIKSNPNAGLAGEIGRYFAITTSLLFSKHARHAMMNVLSHVLRLNQQGMVMMALRDMTPTDFESQQLELFSLKARQVDQTSKALESFVYTNLTQAFGRNLTDLEKRSLTEVCLMTDSQCLLDDKTSIDDIKRLWTDSNARDARITAEYQAIRDIVEKNVSNKQNTENDINWFWQSAKAWARFTTTGVGHELLNLNPMLIAKGWGYRNIEYYSEELVDRISKLATLYAIERTNPDTLKVAATLSNKGINEYLRTAKTFTHESQNGVDVKDPSTGNIITVHTLNDTHMIKGYTRGLYDSSYDIHIDFSDKATQKTMEQAGYKLEKMIGNHRALYRRTFATPKRIDGASLISIGTNSFGTNLRDIIYNTKAKETIIYDQNGNPIDSVTRDELWNAEKIALGKIRKRILAKMLSGQEIDEKFYTMTSSGMTPIYNLQGQITDYRISMDNRSKEEYLGRDMDGLNILSKMYASMNKKANAPMYNELLYNLLQTNMNINMGKNYRDKNDNRFIRLKYVEDTDSNGLPVKLSDSQKFINSMWATIPYDLKQKLNNDKKPLYVREDWLSSIFGVPSMSLTDAKVLQKRPNALVRKSIAIAEYILKTIAAIRKANIVLKIPGVLIGNVMSNYNFNLMTEGNAGNVFKRTIENARAIRDYIDVKRKLELIKVRSRIGTATEEEINSINRLQSRLDSNIVKPLMDKGMYQAIIEDLNPNDTQIYSKMVKNIRKNKLYGKIPDAIKTIANQLYMGEGTLFYELAVQATQYSDFIARANEYQFRMAPKILAERGIKRWEEVTKPDGTVVKRETKEYREYENQVSYDVLEAFVNYDKPQSSLEQYLNDMGLVMFTKFAKRVQRAILKSLTTNPIGSLLFIGSQYALADTEDIFEQNIANKHWRSLFYSPFHSAVYDLVPMPVQFATGMQNPL